MDEEPLDIIPVPALVAVLLHAEREKGAPLEEAEVLHIRDNAECIAAPRSAHIAMVQERGYDDLDPENIWEEWRAFRAASDDTSAAR
ncbi:hypothetical protein [Aurantiacibacter zhengii]|uniref:Uncharacterized protein n=1 Tax=Aurantiacibacter zhengii TaxID=2307003 RepID=A0A418NP42_9SPHN|nr:hypothetical protein [Aurantiacibacter zhengii]RIV83882.1 hypothetical protein D2V07_15475 [Aurantiacibacter zhengii]